MIIIVFKAWKEIIAIGIQMVLFILSSYKTCLFGVYQILQE